MRCKTAGIHDRNSQMKYFFIACYFFLFYSINGYSQKKVDEEKKHNFSISAGYGLAGSFFVTSYQESLPFPSSNYRSFMNKRFVGVAQNFSIAYRVSKNYEIKGGINFQHFTRHVKATDTLQSVIIYLDKAIHHRDYMYFASLHRFFEKKKYLLIGGLGLYYLRDQAELIEYGPGRPNTYIDRDYNYQNSNEEEGGAFIEIAYEYKFQSRVNLGVKSQFYYTISTAEAESITLLPYIKISL